MARRSYFKPDVPADGRNYSVIRQTRGGRMVRDQLPPEGVYTEKEMAAIVERPLIPGRWVKPKQVACIFGLRQIIVE